METKSNCQPFRNTLTSSTKPSFFSKTKNPNWKSRGTKILSLRISPKETPKNPKQSINNRPVVRPIGKPIDQKWDSNQKNFKQNFLSLKI